MVTVTERKSCDIAQTQSVHYLQNGSVAHAKITIRETERKRAGVVKQNRNRGDRVLTFSSPSQYLSCATEAKIPTSMRRFDEKKKGNTIYIYIH